MTHAAIRPEMRKQLGITDSMFRISVGLEAAEDLIGDLNQALNSIKEFQAPQSFCNFTS